MRYNVYVRSAKSTVPHYYCSSFIYRRGDS
nr:MAG TPA: hypothetical protein [Caudoviricetes sp.]